MRPSKAGRNPRPAFGILAAPWLSTAGVGGLIFVMPSDGARMPESDDAMNAYPLFLILHLLAAFLFVGTVTFEVLFLEPVHKRLPVDVRKALGGQLGRACGRCCPGRWRCCTAGLAMAWQYRGALADPLGSPFGILLSLKIALALSVLAHVLTALTLARRQRLSGALSRRMHVSVFCHMVLIVVLAKAMFHVAW